MRCTHHCPVRACCHVAARDYAAFKPALRRVWRRGAGSSTENQSGQVMLIVIGYSVICLLVVTVVMAASAIYLGHKRLLSLADSAAIAAADTFTLGSVSVSGASPVPILNDSAVDDAVSAYLSATSATERFDSLSVEPVTGTVDGRTAHVVLSAVVHPPVVNFIIPGGISISAVSDARSELTR